MTQRLAAGRHHLTRDEVAADQRRRILQALTAVMSKKGYSNTSVADLIDHAKVSRATFYEHFESKQDCFMTGYATTQRAVVDHILTAPHVGTPMERYSVMLDNYLRAIAADPGTSRVYLIEVYSAGPQAIQERLALQRVFVDGVATLFSVHDKADRFACQALVAAISTLVTQALTDGGADEVLALYEPLLRFSTVALEPLLHTRQTH